MPPKENDALTEEQAELIRRWIDAGAPWPDEAARHAYREAEWAVGSTEDGVIIPTSGGLSEQWTYRRYRPEAIWSFRPVVKPDLGPATAGNPVDHFIRARLVAAEVAPATRAGPAR